jgi:hypothetical protein
MQKDRASFPNSVQPTSCRLAGRAIEPVSNSSRSFASFPATFGYLADKRTIADGIRVTLSINDLEAAKTVSIEALALSPGEQEELQQHLLACTRA